MPRPDPFAPPSGRSGYCVGGRVPVSILLAQTDEVYAAITGMVAFPDELRFTLTLRENRSDETETGLVHRHELALWEFETDDAGQVGPDVAYLSIRDAAGHTVGLEDLDGFDGPPGHYRMPLPPPGPLDFTFVWPRAGIRTVTLGLHAEILHAAADRAIRLWEGGDTVSDTSYWTGRNQLHWIQFDPDAEPAYVPSLDTDSWTTPNDMVPGILITEAPVATGDDAAARIDAFRAYPTGFEFTVHVATRDPNLRAEDEDDDAEIQPFALDEGSMRVTFADGRSGRAVMFGQLDIEEVSVHCHEASGSRDRYEATYWVGELPPPGPLTITYSFVRAGIDHTSFDLDGVAIRAAASRARMIFDSDAGTTS